jgi:hypothetical protein
VPERHRKRLKAKPKTHPCMNQIRKDGELSEFYELRRERSECLNDLVRVRRGRFVGATRPRIHVMAVLGLLERFFQALGMKQDFRFESRAHPTSRELQPLSPSPQGVP